MAHVEQVGGGGSSGSSVQSLGFYPVTGADPTGAADSYAAINAALSTTVPATGGQAYLGPGNFKTNTQLLIGNGATAGGAVTHAASTRSGIILRGAAPAGVPNSQGMGNTSATRVFAGVAMSDLMIIAGPLVGWGLQDIELDGNGLLTASVLRPVSAQWGQNRNLLLRGGPGIALLNLQCVKNLNTMHNRWNDCVLVPGTTNGSAALAVNGTPGDGSSNVCYDQFNNLAVQWAGAGSGVTITGFQLTECDNLEFRGVHMYGVGTHLGSNVGITFDYSAAPGSEWPADCLFDGIDFGGSTVIIQNGGVPGGAATANRIVAVGATNGRPANPALANLNWGFSNASP